MMTSASRLCRDAALDLISEASTTRSWWRRWQLNRAADAAWDMADKLERGEYVARVVSAPPGSQLARDLDAAQASAWDAAYSAATVSVRDALDRYVQNASGPSALKV